MGRGEIEQAESLLAEARSRRPDHPQLLETAAVRLAELKGAPPADGGGT
jgi:outer membrane protein TolC